MQMKKQGSVKKSRTDWKCLDAMKDEEIDYSDIPMLDTRFLKKMAVRMPQPKEQVSIRIDPDVLVWFRKQGKGYQTHINAVLRAYVKAYSR